MRDTQIKEYERLAKTASRYFKNLISESGLGQGSLDIVNDWLALLKGNEVTSDSVDDLLYRAGRLDDHNGSMWHEVIIYMNRWARELADRGLRH